MRTGGASTNLNSRMLLNKDLKACRKYGIATNIFMIMFNLIKYSNLGMKILITGINGLWVPTSPKSGKNILSFRQQAFILLHRYGCFR